MGKEQDYETLVARKMLNIAQEKIAQINFVKICDDNNIRNIEANEN